MNLKKIMMASALLVTACCMQAQTKAIAHRGFWKPRVHHKTVLPHFKKQIPSDATVQNLMYGLPKIIN